MCRDAKFCVSTCVDNADPRNDNLPIARVETQNFASLRVLKMQIPEMIIAYRVCGNEMNRIEIHTNILEK